MKRRNFLKILPPLGITPFAVNGFNMRPFANKRMADVLASCDGVRDRVLVLIQLKGGNDGINTLIPAAQYDRYMELRPTTGIPDSGTGAFIPLDGTLPAEDQVGLHPAMTGIKTLYDKGWATVIQAVGYQSMNQSHFKGTDLWLSGGDSTFANSNLGSGWMGRALQAFYPDVEGAPTTDMPDPLGIQVGDPNTSLGFHTETEHQNVLNLSGQDPAGFYSLVQTIGGAPVADVPDSDHGDELKYIMNVESSMNLYAQRITQVFNAGSNAITTYPTDGFAAQLKTVARMIKGGCKTKIYLCQLGGFDTHSGQVGTGLPYEGPHANLLGQMSNAIKTFFDDLEQMGLADQVMAATFSEFGRCAKENGTYGTDHGTLSPLFVFGKGVRPAVHGTNPNLSDLTSDNQLKGLQFDYRQVFGTLLQDWLGANPFVMEESMFDSQGKMFLVEKQYTVAKDCYFGGTPTISDPFTRPLALTPNPAITHTEVSYKSEEDFPAWLTLHSMGGNLVSGTREQVYVGDNIFYFDVSMLPTGFYIVRLENRLTGKADLAKLSVVR
ncbi:MAG: DUF1501 domain-containing protein [Saprospiraceae bacterium]|nr:DUF1501 domain-containing protein [Saprospiraceae bacterium]